MRNILLVIIVFVFGILNALESEYQIARLHYKGGGDWYNDQDTIPNIVVYLNNTLHTDFSKIEAIVNPDDSKLFDYPFIFMTGHGTVNFNNKETENIRTYLERGGFLYVDDDYGLDKSFRSEIQKIFPEKDLVELPVSHNIFHCYFNFPNGLPKIHKHNDERPQAFGIFDDNGQLMLLYTYESNISDGWSNVHDDPENIKEQAFRFGANLFYYIMTN
ncbi:MAG: DUF4159 domain-containing protein [Candidatus Tenebribacter burtonii]|jgi:hypothetical protein|nr:DUF4159 domain-containing protein [Candidatus Tenebribacter burtonii]